MQTLLPLLTTLLLAVPLAAWPDLAAAAPRAAKAKAMPERRGTPYATREDAMEFADDFAARRNLDPAWARRILGQARNLPVVSRLMQPAPPGQPKNWKDRKSVV